MEPVPTYPPDSILDDGGQYFLPGAPTSPHSSSLVSTERALFYEMEDIPTLFEPAPQTSHSVFQEQLFCSYEVHQLNVDTSATPSSHTATEMVRGTVDYIQNNRPTMYNPFHALMNPFQGPMWSPPVRDFPPAVYPNPWNFHSFSPPGTRIWNGLPPIHFDPRAPGNCSVMNMGYLPPSPQFRFSSGPCMVINMPEFWHGAYLPPRQSFLRPEGYPSWCLRQPLGAFYQTSRPLLVYSRRDSMVLNGTPTSEDRSQEEEEHQVFTPDETKEQGNQVSSEPLVAFQDHLQPQWTWEDNKDVPNSICPKTQENVWKEKKAEHVRSMKESPAIGNSSCMDHLGDLSSDSDSVRNTDKDDLNRLLPSDLNTFDDFTLEDLQSFMEDSLDPLFNEKNTEKMETPPPPAEIESIIKYLLSDAPMTEYEPSLNQNEQYLPAKKELKKGLRSFSPLQQSLIEEKSAALYRSFPLDHCFEEDLTHQNFKEVDGDGRKRYKRNSKKQFLKTATQNQMAREKGVLNVSKSNIRMGIRCSQRVKGHTDESDGNGYHLRVEERKPADKFTPQRNSPNEGKKRKQGSVRRELFKIELGDYEEKRLNREKQLSERTVGEEHKKFRDKRQESKLPKGKPLDFCRRMEITREWLSSIQEEPTEEERGEISKVARRKTQSKNAEERVKPAPRKTKGSRSLSKKEVGVNVYEDPGKPQGLTKRGRARENKHETTQAVKVSKKTKAEIDETYFPPAQSKKEPAVDKYSEKALKDKYEPKCPSTRTKKLLLMKTAEVSPEPSPLSVSNIKCSEFLGAKTRKQKVSQRKGSRMRIKPEPSKEQSEDEEAEHLAVMTTAKKHQQTRNTPKKRKGGVDETPEILWSSPGKMHQDSEQGGSKIKIKKERGTLIATWLHTE